MNAIQMVRREKSLEVAPINDGLVRFRASLDDVCHFDEGSEIVHSIAVTGTISLPDLTIRTIAPEVYHQPYPECSASLAPFDQMVGARIGPGFRDKVIAAMGRTRGCTHFMTLVLDLAAAHTLTLFMRMRQRVPFETRHDRNGSWIAAGLGIEPRLENACVALQATGRIIREAKTGAPVEE